MTGPEVPDDLEELARLMSTAPSIGRIVADASVHPAELSFLDQVVASVNAARADKPQATAESRCIAPPLGCGTALDPATGFRDTPSRREYDITGLCQACQDVAFAMSPEDVEYARTHPALYGRCPKCGRYCEIEHVDVGIGFMSGFDCCYQNSERWDFCSAENLGEITEACCLGVGHLYGHSWEDLA